MEAILTQTTTMGNPCGKGYSLGQGDPNVLDVPRLANQNSCLLKLWFSIPPSPEGRRGRKEEERREGGRGERWKGMSGQGERDGETLRGAEMRAAETEERVVVGRVGLRWGRDSP